MKKSIMLIAILIGISFNVNAQAMLSNDAGMIFLNKNESPANALEGKRGGFYGNHPLGEAIQNKYDKFLKLYVKYESSGGAYATEKQIIFKRDIYNSINKLDRYYKKALKKNTIPIESIVEDYEHILDVANQVRFYDTNQLEMLISTAKSEEQIIKYYKSIKFEEESK
ncbi:hypothetical protein [Fulvivirga sp.]|uniref:hypothetical protein n=1 Tax=Fulvivirga sp. TaxID=1931237 RepID=UPI0032F02A01